MFRAMVAAFVLVVSITDPNNSGYDLNNNGRLGDEPNHVKFYKEEDSLFTYPLDVENTIVKVTALPGIGLKDSRSHKGIDLSTFDWTTPDVVCAFRGRVVVVDEDKIYGNYVIVRHSLLNIYTKYAHLSEVYTGVGEMLKAGDPIGVMGNTGRSSGNHLHFGVFKKEDSDIIYLNPIDYLKISRLD